MLQQTNLAADNVTAVEWEKAGALQELDITGTDLPQVISYQSKQKIMLLNGIQNLYWFAVIISLPHEIMKYGMATLSPVLYVSMFVSQSYLCNQ